jgi:hypothetical protein
VLGQIARIERTGHHLDPGMRHADQRPRQVFIGEANGLEHGTRWRTIRAIGDVTTASLKESVMGRSLLLEKIRLHYGSGRRLVVLSREAFTV